LLHSVHIKYAAITVKPVEIEEAVYENHRS
jgi:hypothetical protein